MILTDFPKIQYNSVTLRKITYFFLPSSLLPCNLYQLSMGADEAEFGQGKHPNIPGKPGAGGQKKQETLSWDSAKHNQLHVSKKQVLSVDKQGPFTRRYF